MKIIKAEKLVHEYIHRDEDNQVESIQTALDGVDIEIEKGQFVAILGHNGSGKSTLAKHINALLAPTEGSLWIDGKDVTQEENILPVRKTAGMVFSWMRKGIPTPGMRHSHRIATNCACRISLSITNIRLKRRSRRKAAKGKYRSVKKESL